MKTLKLKSILFSLATLFAITMFVTSCQQDVLTDDLTTMAEASTSETELRAIPQAPDLNEVVGFLNELILNIQMTNTGNPAADIAGAYDAYADYLEFMLCMELGINWDEVDCDDPNIYVGGEACNEFLVNALRRLACDLQAFDADPTCRNSIALQIRFVDYILALEACLRLDLNEDGYAKALIFPECSGYYYPQ